MLDPVGRREVLSAVRRLNREKGITVVLITHHMNEAEDADRVVVMDDGKVALDGTPREVFTQVDALRSKLIPEGLHILAGAPKIGKSWLALWLCLCVSQGQPLWNFAVILKSSKTL